MQAWPCAHALWCPHAHADAHMGVQACVSAQVFVFDNDMALARNIDHLAFAETPSAVRPHAPYAPLPAGHVCMRLLRLPRPSKGSYPYSCPCMCVCMSPAVHMLTCVSPSTYALVHAAMQYDTCIRCGTPHLRAGNGAITSHAPSRLVYWASPHRNAAGFAPCSS